MGDILHYTVVTACWAGTRVVFELHIDGAERYRQHPSTLVVVNHKRDSDSVTVPPSLIFNGVRPIRPMWFAGREDMFVRGFLGLQPPVPRPLRPALARTNLGRVLHALHILPVRRFPERTMHEAVDEFVRVYGDHALKAVLVPQQVEALAAAGRREGMLSDALAWTHRRWWMQRATIRAFLPHWQERLAGRQRAVVDAQVQALAAVLTRGDNLYLAPEGVLSSDGRLQAFRAGFRRILTLTQAPLRWVPAAIVYDFIVPGRMRVFVTVGDEVPAAGSAADIEQEARRALAALHVMTCSQIASRVLWQRVGEGHDTVAVERFAAAVFDQAAALRGSGVRVDHALTGSDRRRRVDAYLAFLTRRGIALTNASEILLDVPYLRRVPATDRQNPLRYAVNEIESVLEILREQGSGNREQTTEDLQ
jgi:hypothetical protein